MYKKMVPANLLEKKIGEVKEKEKTISMLEKKVNLRAGKPTKLTC